MQIDISPGAEQILAKRGGTMTIDFIKPIGWGKVAEVSVDTNIKGKNLAPYRRMRHDEFRILMSPQLVGLASAMRVDVAGGFRKRLTVELDDGTGGACQI